MALPSIKAHTSVISKGALEVEKVGHAHTGWVTRQNIGCPVYFEI